MIYLHQKVRISGPPVLISLWRAGSPGSESVSIHVIWLAPAQAVKEQYAGPGQQGPQEHTDSVVPNGIKLHNRHVVPVANCLVFNPGDGVVCRVNRNIICFHGDAQPSHCWLPGSGVAGVRPGLSHHSAPPHDIDYYWLLPANGSAASVLGAERGCYTRTNYTKLSHNTQLLLYSSYKKPDWHGPSPL